MKKQVLKKQIISLIGTFDEPRDQIKGWVTHNGGTWVNNLDQRLKVLIASEKAWYTDPQPPAIQQARSNEKKVVSLDWLKDQFSSDPCSDNEYSWESIMARTKLLGSKMSIMAKEGQNGKRKHEPTAAEEYGDDEVSENGSDASNEEESTPSPPKKAKKTVFLGANKNASGKKGGAPMSNGAKKNGKLVGVSKQKAPTKVAKPFTGKGGKSNGKVKIAKPTKSTRRAAAGTKREQEDRKKAKKAKEAMASINFTAESIVPNGFGGRYRDRDKGDSSSNHMEREKRVRFESLEPEVFRQPPPKKLQPWEIDLPDGYKVALTDSGEKFWAFLVQTSTDNAQHFRLRLLVSTELPARWQVTLRYRGNAKGIDQTLLEPIDSFDTARAYFTQAYHWLIGKDWTAENDANEEDNVVHTGQQKEREDSVMRDLTNQVIEFSLMPGMPSHDEIKQRRFKDKTGWKVGDGLATKAASVNTGKSKAPAANTSNGSGDINDKGKGKAAAGGPAEVIDIDMTGNGDDDDDEED